MADDGAVLQKISGDNTRTAAELAEIAGKIAGSIDKLSNVSRGIERMDNGVADRISAEMELYAKLEKNSGNWAKQLAACNEMVAATSENAGGMVNESVGNAIANLDRCTGKLENISSGIETSYNNMHENMHAMMKEYRELVTKDMNDTFTAFDKNMSEIVRTLGTAVTDIADAADRIPKALKGSVDALQYSVKQ